jgi:hypothetical protein
VSRLNLAKNVGNICSLKAQPKNSTKGGYLSGGLATIATKRVLMKKDQRNTSEYILATDVLTECDINRNKRNSTGDTGGTGCTGGIRGSGGTTKEVLGQWKKNNDHIKLINVYF